MVTVLTFLVKESTMKNSGVSIFWQYAKKLKIKSLVVVLVLESKGHQCARQKSVSWGARSYGKAQHRDPISSLYRVDVMTVLVRSALLRHLGKEIDLAHKKKQIWCLSNWPVVRTRAFDSEVNLLRFSQTCEFWSSKANWPLRFSLPPIILTDLLGNKTLL